MQEDEWMETDSIILCREIFSFMETTNPVHDVASLSKAVSALTLVLSFYISKKIKKEKHEEIIEYISE